MSMPEELRLEKPFAIVADEDVAAGFKGLGFQAFPTLEEAVNQQAAICLVQDDIYQEHKGFINNYKGLPLPIFIPFARNLKADLLDGIVKDIRLRATGTF